MAVFLAISLAVAADIRFPLAVTIALLRKARIKAPRQSRHGLLLFPTQAAASVAHRLRAADYKLAAAMARAGSPSCLLISAVGGRLIPSLTRNALANRGAEKMPEPYGSFDVAVLVVFSSAWPAGWPASTKLAMRARRSSELAFITATHLLPQ